MSTLHWACKRSNKLITRMLLNFEVDTQIEDMFGRKAIDIARFNEKMSIVRVRVLNPNSFIDD